MEPPIRMKETVDLHSYLLMIWRRKWIVLVPLVVAGLAGYVITMPRFMPKIYECSSTLMIEYPQNLSKELQGIVANPSFQERLQQLDSRIQSNEFLTRIIDNAGMRGDQSARSWAERNQGNFPGMSVDDLVELKLLRYLRKTIRISAKRGNQIQVTVHDYYPNRAYLLASNLTTGIIEASRSSRLEDFRSTEEFSTTQLLEYKRRLDEAEAKLEKFKKSQANESVTPTLVTAATLPLVEEMRRTARSDLDDQQATATRAAAVLDSLGVNAHSLDPLLADKEIADGLSDGKDLESSYVRQTLIEAGEPGLSSQATAIQLARNVNRIEGSLRRTLADRSDLSPGARQAAETYLSSQVRARLARARVDVYAGHLSEYSRRVTSVPEADAELRRLEQDVESSRTLYNIFVKQVTESQISEAYQTSSVGDRITVIEPPEQPLSPVKPRRGPIVALAVIAGLACGILGAFVLEHHDQSFRDVRETEESLGVRVIGTIPNMNDLARSSRSGNRSPEEREALATQAFQRFLDDSPGYQEFRRTALALLRAGESGPKSVLITSARSAEGKSTACTCLAIAMAKELPRENVVLLDFDVRKPALAGNLGLTVNGTEVGTLLREKRWSDRAPRNLLLPNLFIMPMKPLREVTDLVTQENVRWLLQEVRGRFDRIVIDSPPNLPVPDPLILGLEVEAVLMVIKAGVTPRETVRRSVELQRQFHDNVWGILMNNVGEALPYYYSYRHYGYGYRARG